VWLISVSLSFTQLFFRRDFEGDKLKRAFAFADFLFIRNNVRLFFIFQSNGLEESAAANELVHNSLPVFLSFSRPYKTFRSCFWQTSDQTPEGRFILFFRKGVISLFSSFSLPCRPSKNFLFVVTQILRRLLKSQQPLCFV
jgi:hypothetical protein